MRRAVREQVRGGADLIKIMACHDTLEFTDEELHAVIDEAHRNHLPITAHATYDACIERVARFGVDCVEHGGSMSESTVALLLEKKIPIVTTFAPLVQQSQPEVAKRFGIPDWKVEERQKAVANPARYEGLVRAAKAGVPIVFGTDAGSPAVEHDVIAPELAHMVKVGVCPDAMDALAADHHSRGPALAHGRGHRHARGRQGRRPHRGRRQPRPGSVRARSRAHDLRGRQEDARMSLLASRLAPRIVEEDGAFRTRMLALAAGMTDVIALGRGDPDFHTPAHIVAAAKAAIDANHHHYTGPTGLPALRAAIAADLQAAHGLDYGADEIVVTAGAQEGIMLTMLGLCAPGDEVLITSPRFTTYDTAVRLCGGVPVPVPTYEQDDFALDVAEIETPHHARARGCSC